TVTLPALSTPASRSDSGTECARVTSAARPGSPNQEASPVSHSDTGTPLAAAAAATVNAWLQRSGSSLPAVALTTRDLPLLPPSGAGGSGGVVPPGVLMCAP